MWFIFMLLFYAGLYCFTYQAHCCCVPLDCHYWAVLFLPSRNSCSVWGIGHYLFGYGGALFMDHTLSISIFNRVDIDVGVVHYFSTGNSVV